MKFNGSYSVENECTSSEQELKRLEVQTLLSWEKESDLLQLYGMNNKAHLLEVGSGPGFVTNKIQQKWPLAKLTALEIDAEMINRSKQNCSNPEKIHFLNGSVYEIQLENDSVDIVFARFVFQHIDNLDLAIIEIHRVLKPGGKLVVSEIDPELWGRVYPYEPGMEYINHKYALEQGKKGGDRFVVRKLVPKFRNFNFKKIRTDVFSYDSDELGLDLFLPQINPDRYEPLLFKGIITEFEYAAVRASYNRFIENENAYILLLGIINCCEKSE
jgi:ubiquinone/menaquinone biosynthesis C-methylase UbiE